MSDYRPNNPGSWSLLWAALIASGLAGLVNQVVWQRALKIFLGGSETLSSMVVVMVFLSGLGLGAALTARIAGRSRSPLRDLALVELGLAITNLFVAGLLSLDLAESVYGAQRLAVSLGLPIRLVYAVASAMVLLPPTMLMGATIPLASEAAQRQLGGSDEALVPALFFVNTVGAAVGAYGASAWLLPHLGQRMSLGAALTANALAALALLGSNAMASPAEPRSSQVAVARPPPWLERMGGLLGCLALGYEMVLFRILMLAHEPLPHTFAVGLAGFLAAWSVGVAVASRVSPPPVFTASLTALCLGSMYSFYQLDRYEQTFGLLGGALYYFLPCVGFGMLYGHYVREAAGDWGRDVGRYTALNTVGSVLGIVGFTLIGYEMPLWAVIGVLTASMAAIATLDAAMRGKLHQAVPALPLVGGLVLGAYGLSLPYEENEVERTYWGRDGVIEVTHNDQVYIDGLWHTKLTDGTDHIGRPYSWVMAVAAVVAYGDVPPTEALVVGAGVGISSVTLAGVEGLHVDGYEINHTLKRVLRDYPERTLHATERDDVTWTWRDARTGLALREKQYDIILSAPLHLRQAGSSMLLSEEYLRLAKSRLAPGGILAVYSNEGVDAQEWLIRRTLANVFEHQATWYDGIVTIASDRPIELSRSQLEARMNAGKGKLYDEMRLLHLGLEAEGGLYSHFDGNRRNPIVADRAISDDHPLLEYPELAEEVVRPVELKSTR